MSSKYAPFKISEAQYFNNALRLIISVLAPLSRVNRSKSSGTNHLSVKTNLAKILDYNKFKTNISNNSKLKKIAPAVATIMMMIMTEAIEYIDIMRVSFGLD